MGVRLVDGTGALATALRLVAGTCAVTIVPGALLVLLCRPRPQLTMLELAGFGLAVTLGLVQLLTILAISIHVGTGVVLGILLIGSILIAIRTLRAGAPTVAITLDEVIVVAALALLGFFLYRLGSPVDWFEDQVHVAIVRRLSALAAPQLDTIYFTPGVVYTYPFPGTHYLMALVATISEMDALFVYHKLRFFWGPAALVMLYLAARLVFGGSGIATAVAVTAAVFVFSGTFAMVPGFSSGWGQLAPFSHASDVAMTVLLPALLVVAFGFLTAGEARERRFFLGATLILMLMLANVHIRELVQFAVYSGCFLAVTLMVRRLRSHAWRAAVLVGAVVAVALLYTTWEANAVALVTDIVDVHRARLASIARTTSFRTLVFSPASDVLGDYLTNAEQVFVGLTPLFLFAGPLLLVMFAREPLVWLVTSGVVAYLAVMTIPLLAIPYVYATYFEILYTPVRNVIFFVYMAAGALVYAVVVALARIDRTRISLLVAGTAAGALALLTILCLNRSMSGFFAPLIAAYVLAFVLLALPSGRAFWWRASVAAAVAAAGLVALLPEREPTARIFDVSVRWATDLPDDRRTALEEQFSLTHGEPNSNRSAAINVWNYELNDTSRDNVGNLVSSPEVMDTGGIDRSTLTVAAEPPPSDHHFLGVERVTWVQYPGAALFMAAALFVWALGFALPAILALRQREWTAWIPAAAQEPFYRRAVPYAMFIAPFALWSTQPTLSPIALQMTSPARPVATTVDLFAALPCVTTPAVPPRFVEEFFSDDARSLPERTTCPPDAALINWLNTHVPISAVMAIDVWNPYPLSLFAPQQMVTFPLVEQRFVHEDQLFRRYYRFFDERMREHGVQPFFNVIETPAERLAFVEELGVTHVVVDPVYYADVRRVLDGLPDRFTLRYSDGKWAVYEVVGARA